MFSLTYILVIYIMYNICDELFLENNDEEKETLANAIISDKKDEEFKTKLMNASKNKFENSTIMKNRKKKKEM